MFLFQRPGGGGERLHGKYPNPDKSVNKAITKLAIGFLVAFSASLLYFAQNHLR